MCEIKGATVSTCCLIKMVGIGSKVHVVGFDDFKSFDTISEFTSVNSAKNGMVHYYNIHFYNNYKIVMSVYLVNI
jgi:hypothetical protein